MLSMRDIEELMNKIEELRRDMEKVINEKDDLLDTETIRLSKQLDEYLVEYYRQLATRIGR
jgi:hypothetical protein